MTSRKSGWVLPPAAAVVFAALAAVMPAWARTPVRPDGKEIIAASGVRGGLVVHVGCGDGHLTAELHAGDSFIVHGLDVSAENVARARRYILSLGLYGKVAVETFDGRHLPYVDNLVNLLVTDGPQAPPDAEIMRVLAPGGVAMVGRRRIVKPSPADIDDWPEFFHGPDNNALADDRRVGPPRHMHWLAGPTWTRHHHDDKGTNPSVRALVSCGGRLYYMEDRAGTSVRSVPGKWYLIARDAFSGVLLWKRPLEGGRFARRLEQLWRTIVADSRCVYAPLGVDEPLARLDGATGRVVRTYEGTAGLDEFIKDGNLLLVVTADGNLAAIDADTGKTRWRWTPRGDEGAIVPLTMAAAGGKVFVRTDKVVSCISASDGKTVWRFVLPDSRGRRIRLSFPRERLIVSDGVVLCSYAGKDPKALNLDRWQYLGSHPRVHDYGGRLAALSAGDGKVLWRCEYLPGLESTPGEIYVTGGMVWLGPDFARPRDLHTGRVSMDRPVIDRLWTTGHHYRCYPGKATCRYVITAKRGMEFIDLGDAHHSRNNWARGTCRVGILPCNGLIYAPPHSCGCYMEAKLVGFWALAPRRPGEKAGGGASADKTLPPDAPGRLEKGPAYDRVAAAPPVGRPAGWWTY
ncbi:MAG: PQQ-binding-like beta-propeller repeat protein, partial [Planctomycetes bacterium]|nr:PQQ-binding-like beta-propeller repeat protein [Planctomycetota bacterium]